MMTEEVIQKLEKRIQKLESRVEVLEDIRIEQIENVKVRRK